jgi:acyl carrier protein
MPRPWRSSIKTISLCHVADVVDACLLAAKDDIPGGEVCIISEPELYTWENLRGIVTRAFARLVAGGAAQTQGDGAALLARIREMDIMAGDAARQQYWGCDTSKARTVLGFQTARSVRESATETIRSYIAAGLLAPFFEIGSEAHGDIHVSPAETRVVTEAVRDFILSSFMPGDPDENLRDDDLLLEGGIVDSAGVMSLVLFLEERFGIQILDEELFAENFGTVDRMTAFVASKLGT